MLAEALYHSWGKENGLKPYRAMYRGIRHWWLQDDHGNVYDLSAGQFHRPFPYDKGKPGGFLTKEPSRRAQKLMWILNEVRHEN